MVICDLWLCISNAGEEGGLPNIWEAYQSYVCDDFELHRDPKFLRRLSWLGIFGDLHRSRGKMLIAQAAAPAFQHDLPSVLTGHVCDDLAGFRLLDDGPLRDF